MAVTWVELAGAVGAGKSSLVDALDDALRGTGREVIPEPGRSATGTRSAKSRAVEARDAAVFIARHTRFALLIGRVIAEAPLPSWHRRAIARVVLRLGAADQSLRARDRAVVVVDEGWAHRAVNLFGWFASVHPARLEDYLRLMPRPDLLVVVTAPDPIVRERLARRSLPKRLRGKEPQVVEGFLARSSTIVAAVADWLEEQGVPVIRVANDGSLGDAEAALRREVEAVARRWPSGSGAAVGLPGPTATPIVRIRRPFPLPRPDRAIMAATRRRPPPGDQETRVTDALAEWRLADARVEPLQGGGRGLTYLVHAPWGPAALKCYKPSLSTESIRVEHAVLGRLAEVGFPSPRLHATPGGATLVEVDGGRFALTAWLPGFVRWDLSLLPPRESRCLRVGSGAALARLHGALEDFIPPGHHEAEVAPSTDGGRRDAAWHAAAITRCASEEPPVGSRPEWLSLWRRADEIAARIGQIGEGLEREGLPTTVIHGDYGPYNLLFRSGEPLVIMDFELARRDWRLIDLARAIPRFSRNRWASSTSRRDAFLEGYLASVPIPRIELQALPAMSVYLDLRRTAILWWRYTEGGGTRDLAEAATSLHRADDILDGRYPLT